MTVTVTPVGGVGTSTLRDDDRNSDVGRSRGGAASGLRRRGHGRNARQIDGPDLEIMASSHGVIDFEKRRWAGGNVREFGLHASVDRFPYFIAGHVLGGGICIPCDSNFCHR